MTKSGIKGLEQWETEAKEWSVNAGRLRMRAGSGLVGALESWYALWKEKPTPKNTREYLLWRLRLHLKWNAYPDFLEELDENFDIGLHDSRPGECHWHIPPETKTGITTGFNWRRDSGEALKGRKPRSLEEEPLEDLAE